MIDDGMWMCIDAVHISHPNNSEFSIMRWLWKEERDGKTRKNTLRSKVRTVLVRSRSKDSTNEILFGTIQLSLMRAFRLDDKTKFNSTFLLKNCRCYTQIGEVLDKCFILKSVLDEFI